MSFTSNIPASGQTLGNSRPQVLNNFAILRSTISQGSGNPGPGDKPNHIDVNDIGAGKHIFVEMPVQTPGAANLPTANEGGMITQTSAGSSELFYVRDAVSTYFQMTGPLFTGKGGNSVGGTTMLFGGIILKWGQVTSVGSTQAISFVTECGSVFPTACFAVVESGSKTGNFFPSLVSASGFTSNNGQAGAAIFFIAIGN